MTTPSARSAATFTLAQIAAVVEQISNVALRQEAEGKMNADERSGVRAGSVAVVTSLARSVGVNVKVYVDDPASGQKVLVDETAPGGPGLHEPALPQHDHAKGKVN